MSRAPIGDVLDRVAALEERGLQLEVLERVPGPGGERLPVYAVTLGNPAPDARVLCLVGGVHGLERVGGETVVTWLEILAAHLRWDGALTALLREVRIEALPMVNPWGYLQGTRSNGRGVDLMRNAPVDAQGPVPWLLGGHRYGPWLPWFRGRTLEPEARALIHALETRVFPAPVAACLDVHSGFGRRDRLWYPFARQHGGYPREPEARRLAALLDATHPDNRYRVEPQSASYTTHGDLWDHLFDRHVARYGTGRVFMPWTLELGSWSWALRSPLGWSVDRLFNPPSDHHLRRTVRKHYALLDFFLRAVASPRGWLNADG